jgi:hypothetical protein
MQIQWNSDSAVVLDFISFLTSALFCWFQPSVHKNNIKPQLILQFLDSILYFSNPDNENISNFTLTMFYLGKLKETLGLFHSCSTSVSVKIISLHMNVFEPHMTAQPITYTHSYAHSYTWVAANICFRIKLIKNTYTMLGIVYKHGTLYTAKPLWTDTPRLRTLLYYGRFFRSVT